MDCFGDLSPCSKVIAYLAAHLASDEDRSTAIKAATNLYAPRRARDLHAKEEAEKPGAGSPIREIASVIRSVDTSFDRQWN